ncbi:MAG: 4Fe-4S binding protein [Deltaproteobacteria bacterium]|nr:4Fe-4S binding protein [Deltaproteobacteria bacterium]
MKSDLSSIFQVILSEGHIFSEHAGFSGKKLRGVGPIQYAVHWLYGVFEPVILRIVDYVLSIRFLTKTVMGRKILYVIASISWFFPHGVVVTTAAAERMVDFVERTEGPKGARIAVGPCVCQMALNRWQEPSKKDMVLLYGADIYYHLNMGYELISAEKAKGLLREFDAAGLVHAVEFCLRSGKWIFVICNCDDKICAPTRIFLHTGKMLFPGPEIVNHDRKLCIGREKCGKCLERCIIGVNFVGDDGKVAVDYDKCMGCGLCVNTCPGKARTMVKRENYRHGHQVPADLLLGKTETVSL